MGRLNAVYQDIKLNDYIRFEEHGKRNFSGKMTGKVVYIGQDSFVVEHFDYKSLYILSNDDTQIEVEIVENPILVKDQDNKTILASAIKPNEAEVK